jgi:hypothetical protein
MEPNVAALGTKPKSYPKLTQHQTLNIFLPIVEPHGTGFGRTKIISKAHPKSKFEYLISYGGTAWNQAWNPGKSYPKLTRNQMFGIVPPVVEPHGTKPGTLANLIQSSPGIKCLKSFLLWWNRMEPNLAFPEPSQIVSKCCIQGSVGRFGTEWNRGRNRAKRYRHP